MRIRRLGLLIILVLAASSFFGCGDETKTTETGGAADEAAFDAGIPDPCVLLSKAEVESITGDTVTSDPTRVDSANLKACNYSVAGHTSMASITIIKPCSMADYANMSTGDPVEGIGMHAAWDRATLTVHTMTNECLIASGAGPAKGQDPASDAAALETAKAVAMKVIEGLSSADMNGNGDMNGNAGTVPGGSGY